MAREVPEEAKIGRMENTIDMITGPALLRGFCGFTLGMISYQLYQENWMKKILKKGFWFTLIWSILMISWIGDYLSDGIALFLFAALVLHLAYVEGITKQILNNRLFTYLGNISYSIYLVHIPILFTFMIYGMISGGGEESNASDPEAIPINYLANWMTAIVFLLISLGVASLTYFFIERPARRWINRT